MDRGLLAGVPRIPVRISNKEKTIGFVDWAQAPGVISATYTPASATFVYDEAAQPQYLGHFNSLAAAERAVLEARISHLERLISDSHFTEDMGR